jgi:diacylglycerol kinase (ATP)
MLNKKGYSLMKNLGYALNGLKELISYEISFKLELISLIFIIPIVIYLDVTLIEKIFLFSSFMLVLVAEALNGAIERVVDLVTTEYHPLAEKAKDTASGAVLIAIILSFIIWVTILYSHYKEFF